MNTDSQLPLDIRQEVFRQLVEQQDRGVPVPQSRSDIASQFSLSSDVVQTIEREGISNSWPPLS